MFWAKNNSELPVSSMNLHCTSRPHLILLRKSMLAMFRPIVAANSGFRGTLLFQF